MQLFCSWFHGIASIDSEDANAVRTGRLVYILYTFFWVSTVTGTHPYSSAMTPQVDRSFWAVVIEPECSESFKHGIDSSNGNSPAERPKAVCILPRMKGQVGEAVPSPLGTRASSSRPHVDNDTNINEAAQHLIALHHQDVGGRNHEKPNINTGVKKVRYECAQCKALFRRKSYLRKHVSAVHKKLKPYRCNLCERPFGYRGALAKHFRTIHLGEKPFICTGKNCNMRFSERGNLKKHFRNKHSKEERE